MDNNEMNNSFHSGYTKGLGFGLFLMVLGIVFLGLNFGFIPAEMHNILISWQMLLIVIGLWKIIVRQRFISGTIALLVGVFFIIPRVIEAYPTLFPGLTPDFTHVFWPFLLIAAGLLMIMGKVFGPKWTYNEWNRQPRYQQHHRYKTRSTGNFSKNSVFGNGEHIVLDPVFSGGEMNAVFGGMTIDLRRTTLKDGETVLEVNAVFGGVTIYVPSDWTVEIHVDAVFGGFQDKRASITELNPAKKLIIDGSCVFGGGELLN